MIDFNVKSYMRTILPVGKYTFKVVSCEIKPTKSNPECRFVGVGLEVISDFRKGSRFFDNFNIYHIKDTVQDIGRARFAEFCDAIGLPDLKNVTEAIGHTGEASVSEEYYNGQLKNKVDKYFQIVGERTSEIKPDEVPFDDDIAF